MMDFLLHRVPSPIGTVLLLTSGDTLRALDFEDHEDRMHLLLRRQNDGVTVRSGSAPPHTLAQRLSAYFEGDMAALDEIPVETGGTPFQREVWQALRGIGPGQTTTYGQLAARLGRPGASRAVGLANGANPVAVLVPCHRVVGSAGLTGYGGGLWRKQWLLEHEAHACGMPTGAQRTLAL